MYPADDESTNGPKPPEPNKCIHPETPTHYGDLEKHTMFTNNTMYTFYRLFQVSWCKKKSFWNNIVCVHFIELCFLVSLGEIK